MIKVFIEASLSEKGSSSQGNFITFDITDEPGQWFRNVGGELLPGTTKSLGVVESKGTAHFIMSSTNTVHTISSLLWPTGAPNMPFDQMTSLPRRRYSSIRETRIISFHM